MPCWAPWACSGSKAPGSKPAASPVLSTAAVHGVTELVGKGLQAAFTQLEPTLAALVDASPDTPQREAVLAALNGVLGDQLEQSPQSRWPPP
jgi:hypothetical protein